jgi:phosphatidate cytidylyltransferase
MRFPVSTNFLQRSISSVVLTGLFWSVFFYLPPIWFTVLLYTIFIFVLKEWMVLLGKIIQSFTTTRKTVWRCIGILYPVLPFILLIGLSNDPHYRPLLFFLFVMVFSFDTGSYIFGNLFGRHLLVPHISRKKTGEGVFGGYLLCCAALWLITWADGVEKSLAFVALLSIPICFLALCGDLFESWLKRQANIKDSGNLLPGHGGFLDRFDGILFAVFFFYFLRDYLIYTLKIYKG